MITFFMAGELGNRNYLKMVNASELEQILVMLTMPDNRVIQQVTGIPSHISKAMTNRFYLRWPGAIEYRITRACSSSQFS